jgi:hypothetical protein
MTQSLFATGSPAPTYAVRLGQRPLRGEEQ